MDAAFDEFRNKVVESPATKFAATVPSIYANKGPEKVADNPVTASMLPFARVTAKLPPAARLSVTVGFVLIVTGGTSRAPNVVVEFACPRA